MDIHSISKIVNRKMLVQNVEQIQQRVQKGNKEIIKLHLNQDCAIWDQKEKLANVKAEHERLQQNMLQAQMQYESLSNKYQEELRSRPEMLNKHNYTRKIFDELEKLVLDCMARSARGKADRDALMKAYAAADATVCALEQQYVTTMEQAKSTINEKLGELKEKSEQQEKLIQKYQDSQVQLHTLQRQLEAARSKYDELCVTTGDTKNKLEAATNELYKNGATISNLQREMRNMAVDIHSQLAEAKNILMKKDNDLKSAADEIASLKKALSNQEEFTKVQCDRNNELLEKLALCEEQLQQAVASSDDYKKKLEEMTSICENFKNNMVMIKDENEALTKEMDAKQQLLNLYTEELQSLRQRVLDDGFNLDKITLELNKTIEESLNKNILIEKLETEIGTLSKTLSETQNDFKNYREEAEEKLKSLAETIQEKCQEIENHSSAAMQANKELQSEKEERANLVVELQNITASLEERGRELEVKTSALIEEKEARAKIESDLVDQKREFEIEMDTLREQQKEMVSKMEAGMRAKEEEHSRSLADFLKKKTDLLLNLYTEELQSLRQRVLDDGFNLDKITLELNKTIEESLNKNILIEKLETEIGTLSKTLSETQNDFKNYREEAEEILKSLAETIQEKCQEIENHSSAAMQANKELQSEKEERANLVVELQNITASLEERGRELEVKTSALIEEKEARAKIESDLVDQKREFEIEMDTLREQQKEMVSKMEAGMRAKEEEHSRSLADFLKKKTDLEREKAALQDVIKGLEQRIKNIGEMASKTKPPSFQPAPDEDAVSDWVLSTYREANQGQNNETDEDAMMLHDDSNFSEPSFDSMRLHDDSNFSEASFDSMRLHDDSNFSEASFDSMRIRPLPKPATEKRYFAWASEMRSPRQASPTPAAIQRVRDAPFTALQSQSQADQLTSSVEELSKLTKTSKQARPDTPLMGRAARRNDAAAAIRPLPKPATEKRYFAWASEMRSPSQASPTPEAIQRVRYVPFTATKSQADQTRAALPSPAKRARPDAPMGRAAKQNDTPASNAATAGSKTTTKERRFFKSKGSKKSK